MFLWEWLLDAVSWLLVTWHQVLSLVLDPNSGVTWALSIVGLVVVIRILLIPLFVKQIRAQRGMQEIQPQLKAIQAKYAGDKERQSQEMMKLYKDTGTNPLASCLPILLQAPIFFALFRVLRYGVAQRDTDRRIRLGALLRPVGLRPRCPDPRGAAVRHVRQREQRRRIRRTRRSLRSSSSS